MVEERARTARPVGQDNLSEMADHEPVVEPAQTRLAFPGYKNFDPKTGEYRPPKQE